MSRLILIRHAKSDWSEPLPDHDRSLNRRGRHAAVAIGDWLAQHGFLPDLALCSTALRAVETWQRLSARLPGPVETRFLGALYHAAPGTMLTTLRREGRGGCVAMIGHNPGIGALAAALVANPPDHPRFADYPTAATTVIDFDADWPDITPGSGRCTAFVVPRDLTG